MPSDVVTLCFHTRDAVERDDSSLTFDMPSARTKLGATKVALASCEFPMVQQTIEAPDWNRLYFNEGVRLHADLDNFLDLSVDDAPPVRVRLPPRLNAVRIIVRRAERAFVECAHPHGLFDGATGVVMLGNPDGDLVASDVRVASPTAFSFSAPRRCVATHVHVATVPSPHHLCERLTEAARCTPIDDRVTVEFSYDAEADRVLMRARSRATDRGAAAPAVHLRVFPTDLARLCGLSTFGDLRLLPDGRAVESPGVATGFWDYVEMPGGFYAPCHRPMCVGQPMRFGVELETATNRLYFPILAAPAAAASGGSAAGADHLLVFCDPMGRVLSCAVPAGRYAPEAIAAHLERGMTRALGEGAAWTFAVRFQADARFLFACETVADGNPAPFSLLFHHPRCIDAARFGFVAQPMQGSSCYVAPHATRAAAFPAPIGAPPRRASNILRVSEMSAQKRFRLHAASPPPMVAVVIGGSLGDKPAKAGAQPAERARGARVQARTFVNGRLFAHGYQEGDVVRVTTHEATRVEDVDGKEREAKACTCDLPAACSAVVESVDGICDLTLRLPSIAGVTDADACLQIIGSTEPWNLHFRKPHCLPYNLMGFRESAVLWGLDGTVGDGLGNLLPPYEAPHAHSLDHPDYVLITFSEASGGSFDHAYGGQNKSVFCKLSLYPLFREERMLPRDSSLQYGNMARFRIQFWNPDFVTPYKFHGAEFSFSLNFVIP